jgi:hypothetical protein
MLAGERFIGKTSAYAFLPKPLRTAMTFAIVCLAWVFFRANTIQQAGTYLLCLVGQAAVSPGQSLALRPVYNPFHSVVFLTACVLVWGAPNSWVVSRRITAMSAIGALMLLAVSVMFMWTQTENPFIYFQF